jgi:TonB family protein
MSIATEVWKAWEGKTIDGKFPLQEWIGESQLAAVFQTERAASQKAAIKLIPASSLDADLKLGLWAEATRLTHSHLIRLYEYGRCQLDSSPFVYVVMEYAEENLGEIVPVRPLSIEETLEMLRPAAEALAFLHRAGFVHSAIKPSNILAVGNELKLSSDRIQKAGDRRNRITPGQYDASEVASTGYTPASDVWSLGMVSVAVMTQKEPARSGDQTGMIESGIIAPPVGRILQECLQTDAGSRASADGILRQISAPPMQAGIEPARDSFEQSSRHDNLRRWLPLSIVVVALLLAVWGGIRWMNRERAAPSSQAESNKSTPVSNATRALTPGTSPASAERSVVRGTVLRQVMPEVSSSALHTVSGRIKVVVETQVDNSGEVTAAKLITAGPSRYFSSRALAAAQQWKFTPPKENGTPTASEWILRFEITRKSVQVSPTEKKP